MIFINVTKQTGGIIKLTLGMIRDLSKNQDGTAKIELQNENVIFDTVETYDWVNDNYRMLI